MTFAQDDLLRALAQPLARVRDFSAAIPDDEAAARLFLDTIHQGRCPVCRGDDVRLAGRRTLLCRTCRRRRSLTSTTPLHRTRVPLRIWLAAVWHIFVDTETSSARAFGRRYALRAQTAWQLLHRVRDAIVYPRPREGGMSVQLLGRQSVANVAFVTLAHDGDGLTAALADEAPPSTDAPAPVLALWLGRLRAWICDVFRGVSRRHLPRYLAELVARFRRATSCAAKA